MNYSKETGNITFDQSKISDDEVGTYRLKLVITDITNLRSIYYIEIEVKGLEAKQDDETTILIKEDEVNSTNS